MPHPALDSPSDPDLNSGAHDLVRSAEVDDDPMVFPRCARLLRQQAMPELALTIAELFERWAEAQPEALALIAGTEQVTYGELNRRANRLAHFLIARGVRCDVPVGICTERSIEMVVGLLGILKAGGVYLPLDADFPAERLEFMLQDTEPDLVLTQRHLHAAIPASPGRRMHCLEPGGVIRVEDGGESERNPGVARAPDQLAYLIYTSGSTGTAKGVALTHRGVVRLVAQQDYAPFRPGERFLVVSSPSFDAIIFELWGPLLNGAACVLMPDRWPEADRLEHLIRTQAVTCAFLTTGLFNQLIDHRPQALAGLRTLVVGGEAHSAHHTRRARGLLPATQLVNGYGPTECTTFACAYRIAAPEAWGCDSVPIGRPLNNTECVIVDDDLRVVPVGTPGELLLGGPGLAREYWRRPELTAARFVPHPLPGHDGERLYRTSDRCRMLPNGLIEFLGRIDDLIKLRGYRIEPGEIELVLRGLAGVRDATVFVREHGDARQLAAVFVREPATPAVAPAALRQHLLGRLPEHLVPVLWQEVAELPLTANGKVDRRALARMAMVVPSSAPLEPEAAAIEGAEPLTAGLLAVWRRVLGQENIGPHDDFFACGGDSLSCMELALEIGRLINQPVSVGWVHQAPTAAAMARRWRESRREPAVEAEPGRRPGHARRLFQIPALQGLNAGQAALALALPDGWTSCDTLIYPGSRERSAELMSMEDFAAEMIRQIKRQQPGGPYALTGYSFGALVAYEAARQLAAAGETVSKLLLFDPGFLRDQSAEPVGQLWGRAARRIWSRLATTIGRGDWRGLWQLSELRRRQLRHPVRWLVPRLRVTESLKLTSHWSGDFIAGGLRAFERYRLHPYAGDVVLFRGLRNEGMREAGNPWLKAVRGRLTLHELDCGHGGMLRAPMLAEVIALTCRELER